MKWLSPTTIAETYSMSAKSVHRMIDRGELPAVVFPNGKKRVSEQALEKTLRRSSREHGAHPSTRGDDACLNSDSGNELPAVQSGNHRRKSA